MIKVYTDSRKELEAKQLLGGKKNLLMSLEY